MIAKHGKRCGISFLVVSIFQGCDEYEQSSGWMLTFAGIIMGRGDPFFPHMPIQGLSSIAATCSLPLFTISPEGVDGVEKYLKYYYPDHTSRPSRTYFMSASQLAIVVADGADKMN